MACVPIKLKATVMNNIPLYIERRIRRAAPIDSYVVDGSTPVISFGDALQAKVATLGINPSRVEFLDNKGVELVEDQRRLATHQSLGCSDLSKAPDTVIAQVLDECCSYFEKKPYMKWFKPLEEILNGVDASYFAGSACHLDLVQWATDPVWAKLEPKSVRQNLIEADAQFLSEQLSNENIQLLLLNGTGVISAVQSSFGVGFDEDEPIVGLHKDPVRIFTGKLFDHITVIGWSVNLQSSFGVSLKLRHALKNKVAEIYAAT